MDGWMWMKGGWVDESICVNLCIVSMCTKIPKKTAETKVHVSPKL